MSPHRWRRRFVLRHPVAAATAAEAEALVGHLPPDDVLWAETSSSLRAVAGRDYSAVVLDLHLRLDLDAIGLAHGLVRGGGALILRVPTEAPPDQTALAAPPYDAAPGDRTWRRLTRRLSNPAAGDPPEPLTVAPAIETGSEEQTELVARLTAALRGHGSTHVVLADRGRGKSAALGMVLAQLRSELGRVAVTAPAAEQLQSVQRFDPLSRWVSPLDVPDDLDLLVVDEAAGLAVPTLQALSHCARRVVFATTVHGYEGHGRGFSLQFLPWLEARRPVTVHRLSAPIRWAPDDPLERWTFDALLLDAVPTESSRGRAIEPQRLDREALAADEDRLRQVFGLLVAAHYRTTPNDLLRLLDAANLEIHALLDDRSVVAAALVAREGGLSRRAIEPLRRGRGRLRGQALAETLVRHSGELEAASWNLRRNVRTAVVPSRQREGLGRRLAEAVHDSAAPDAFGTMFGATPELLSFRRAQGYQLVRVGGARSNRSGLLSVVMLRPETPRARALVDRLQRRVARDLPHQLALAAAEHPLPEGLAAALRDAVVDVTDTPDPRDDRRRLQGYLDRTHTDWAVVGALVSLLEERDLSRLAPAERQLVEGRLRHHHAWRDLAAERDASIRTTMRALRHAIATLVEAPG